MKQDKLVLLVPPETPVKLAPPGRLAKAVQLELQDRQALREIQALPELQGKRVSRVEPEPPGPRVLLDRLAKRERRVEQARQARLEKQAQQE